MPPKNPKQPKNSSPQPPAQEPQENNQAPGNTFFGSRDNDETTALPADWKDKVCVKQCKIDTMNGGMVEVPNTHQLQTYEPEVFDRLKDGANGSPSFFSESKMKVDVLHDPRD